MAAASINGRITRVWTGWTGGELQGAAGLTQQLAGLKTLPQRGPRLLRGNINRVGVTGLVGGKVRGREDRVVENEKLLFYFVAVVF